MFNYKNSTNIGEFLDSLKIILKLVENEKDAVIKAGAVPYIVKLFDDIHLEPVAIFMISDLSFTDNKQSIQILIESGCILPLIKRMNSNNLRIRNTSAMTLVNIRLKSDETFHNYIDAKLLPCLLEILKSSAVPQQIHALSVIYDLTRHQQLDAIPIFAKLPNSSYPDICSLGGLTIVKHATVKYPLNKAIIQAGALPHLINFLNSSDQILCNISLKILTNICSGSIDLVQAVIDAKAIPALINLLNSTNLETCCRATMVLHNITNETKNQAQTVITAGATPHLIRQIYLPDEDIRYASLWALKNITHYCTVQQCHEILEADIISAVLPFLTASENFEIEALIIFYNLTFIFPNIFIPGIFEPLIKKLDSKDSRICSFALLTLANMVYGNYESLQVFIQADGINAVIKLLESEDIEISTTTLKILYKIASGTSEDRQVVLESDAILELTKLLKSPDPDIHDLTSNILNILETNSSNDTEFVPNLNGTCVEAQISKCTDKNPTDEEMPSTILQQSDTTKNLKETDL
uniref:Importin subunit alpha n=1 Tax=Panagrolaimus superbus TaxID=310955 RepID=A0A914ZB51_9BILA